ncbi:hypothetical protein IVB36_04015 [Bradyrhizobium sp. 35]|uniref:hypothetical protein n=1 Tax=Bradyrhizobium sp. 35 TaxID=2782670 RepID=UPI001FF7292F|nr:hypothetical protein [Bradyrhizobium sp. 35]MCK1450093.1 hypothetical protein [Bradyrhizobium sp. 35]
MKFFLPFAADEKQAEETYEAIKKFVAPQGDVSDTRYYAIYYRHNGQELRARVGDPDPLTGEPVIAILRSSRDRGPFYVCTPNRGVVRGDPILADGGPHTRAIHFEQ